jgi:hypothetical protein
MTTPNKINFPPPKLQIDFAFALKRFRAVYLQSALLETVRDMDIAELDKQLAEYVPPADLATLRSTACGLNCCSPCLPCWRRIPTCWAITGC